MARQIRLCIAIALLATTVGTSAQEAKRTLVYINGVGTHSCGVYLEFRNTNNDEMKNLYQ
jgi:hypothetical protein